MIRKMFFCLFVLAILGWSVAAWGGSNRPRNTHEVLAGRSDLSPSTAIDPTGKRYCPEVTFKSGNKLKLSLFKPVVHRSFQCIQVYAEYDPKLGDNLYLEGPRGQEKIPSSRKLVRNLVEKRNAGIEVDITELCQLQEDLIRKVVGIAPLVKKKRRVRTICEEEVLVVKKRSYVYMQPQVAFTPPVCAHVQIYAVGIGHSYCPQCYRHFYGAPYYRQHRLNGHHHYPR